MVTVSSCFVTLRGMEDCSPMNGKEEGEIRYIPSLYMANVTAKYMVRLPHTKIWLTAVQ